MEFVLTIKELRRRWVFVVPGLVLACLGALAIAFNVTLSFPPKFASRQHQVWVADAQVFIDSTTSAVGSLNQALDPLIPRATVYANMMTSPALAAGIAQSAHIPVDELTVVGPIGTNGQRPVYGATVKAPGPVQYLVTLNTDLTQPLIRVSAQAATPAASTSLANASAASLSIYVGRVEQTDAVLQSHRVIVRELGRAIASSSESGIAPVFVIPIMLLLGLAWSMLVLLVSRFIASWRSVPADGTSVAQRHPVGEPLHAAEPLHPAEPLHSGDEAALSVTGRVLGSLPVAKPPARRP